VNEPASVTVDARGSTLWVSLRGEMDMSNADSIEETLRDQIEQGVDRVVIDLSQLLFIDSSGVRVLLALGSRFRERRRELILVVPDAGIVRRVLSVSGVDAIVAVEADPADIPAGDPADGP
jgi:anti-anti-sigma factor